jgi:hypothetical protein
MKFVHAKVCIKFAATNKNTAEKISFFIKNFVLIDNFFIRITTAKIYEFFINPSARNKNQGRDALAAYRTVLEAQMLPLLLLHFINLSSV